MISKKTFTIALVVVAALAAIGAPPKVLNLTYNSSTSPYNTGWNGTSHFVEALKGLGYEVEMLNSLQSFLELEGDKILYVSIAPDYPHKKVEIEKFKELFKSSSLRILFADEESSTANQLLRELFRAEMASGYLVKLGSSEPAVGAVVVAEFPRGGTYYLRLNVASAVEELGTLQPKVKAKLPLVLMVEGGSYVYRVGGYPIVCVWSSNDDKAIVISDSSIFINLYFENPEISDNEEYVLKLVEYLTDNDKNYKVYIDNYHYNTIDSLWSKLFPMSFKLTIPPPGLIFAIATSKLLKYLDVEVLRLIRGVLEFRILALIATLLVAYYFISKREPSTGYDEEVLKFEEVLVVGETPIKKRLASKKFRKEEYKYALSALYEVLEDLFKKYAGIELSKTEDLEFKAKNIVGKEHLKALNVLKKIHQNVREGKRIFPPILFWGRTFNSLVRECEVIAEKFGASILGKEGLESVEYKLRKE